MTNKDDKLAALVARVNKQIASGKLDNIDNLTVKELKLKMLDEADKLTSNDDQASIISVVVYVVVT
jgi:hypothetical protein